MRQLIAIIVQMRRLKNEVEETDEAILRGLVEQTLSGTLPARDLFISEELNREILGKESFRRREVRLKDFLEENKSSLDIVVHDGLVSKTESFLLSASTMRATALCGPSFSGKSTIIQVNDDSNKALTLNFENFIRVFHQFVSPISSMNFSQFAN